LNDEINKALSRMFSGRARLEELQSPRDIKQPVDERLPTVPVLVVVELVERDQTVNSTAIPRSCSMASSALAKATTTSNVMKIALIEANNIELFRS
jgi:hypothetical protein